MIFCEGFFWSFTSYWHDYARRCGNIRVGTAYHNPKCIPRDAAIKHTTQTFHLSRQTLSSVGPTPTMKQPTMHQQCWTPLRKGSAGKDGGPATAPWPRPWPRVPIEEEALGEEEDDSLGEEERGGGGPSPRPRPKGRSSGAHVCRRGRAQGPSAATLRGARGSACSPCKRTPARPRPMEGSGLGRWTLCMYEQLRGRDPSRGSKLGQRLIICLAW